MMEADQLTLFAPDTLASLSVLPGSEKAKKMTATSGRKCLGLSKSSGRLGSLEKMLLDTSRWGSTMYLLTWKVLTTQQGRSYFRLHPSSPHTDETEYSLWATPNTMDCLPQRSDEALIRQATTTRKGRTKPANLREQVDERVMKLWPTPQARDYRSGDNPDSIRADRKAEQGWSPNLNDAVKLWPTPAAQDAKNGTLPPSQIDRDTVPGAVMREGHQGQLNPEWVEALMGFPIGWTDLDTEKPAEFWINNPRWPSLMGQEQHEWEPPRVAGGVKNRVPRLKACGNAVVPAQVYPILEAIKAAHEAKAI